MQNIHISQNFVKLYSGSKQQKKKKKKRRRRKKERKTLHIRQLLQNIHISQNAVSFIRYAYSLSYIFTFLYVSIYLPICDPKSSVKTPLNNRGEKFTASSGEDEGYL
ncbi:hypothetical protein ACOSQ3_018287 [Xanthoceras sorbifolium]